MIKPQSILELEKALNLPFTEVPEDWEIPFFLEWQNSARYAVSNATVTGLYINGATISPLPHLNGFTYLRQLCCVKSSIGVMEGLENFRSLEKLDLSHNQIQVIQNLRNLTNLTSLDLSSNQIQVIQNLEKLTNLNVLRLSYNQIQVIQNLEKLTRLSNLDLSSNQIQVIQNLEELTNLTDLNLSDNQIQVIQNLEELTNLNELRINNNQIQVIQNLGNLTNLNELRLYNNQIQVIQNLENLTNLNILNLFYNQIQVIQNLEKLTNLNELDLSNNQIQVIQNLEKLVNLKKLDLSSNQISEPNHIQHLFTIEFLTTLEIDGNPFVTKLHLQLKPYENHLELVKNAWQKYISRGKIKVALPLQVNLLGNHSAGKSSFLNRYFQKRTKTKSTHVLNVVHSTAKIRKIPTAIFYDYGGQDYYHGIYQAFLSSGALTLLFWYKAKDKNRYDTDSNGRQIVHFNRPYWLGQLKYAHIQNNAKYTLTDNQKPIFLVQTHSDTDAVDYTYSAQSTASFYISLLKDQTNKEPNVSYLNTLQQCLNQEITRQNKVEKTVYELKLYKYILSHKGHQPIPVKDLANHYLGMDNLNLLKAELHQLSLSGMVLYRYYDPELNDTVWLNPAATVTHIHNTLLGNSIIEQHKGKITASDFKALVEEKKIDAKTISMLKKNKVLFEDSFDKSIVIPGYLPLTKDCEEDFFTFMHLGDYNFILLFDSFIPFGFMNQLICYFGKNPEKKQFRRDQLVFTYKGHFRILIQLDFEHLEVKVSITSKNQSVETKTIEKEILYELLRMYWGFDYPTEAGKPTDLQEYEKATQPGRDESAHNRALALIRSHLGIRDETELSWIPEDLYLSINGKDYVHLLTLENPEYTTDKISSYRKHTPATQTGNPETHESTLDKSHSIDLSTRPFTHLSNNPKIRSMKKIFISYSRKDVEYKDELKKHLNLLNVFEVADAWSCDEIRIGNWHEQIQKELDDSDLIIYMLSVNFFSSYYILDQEVRNGLEMASRNPHKKFVCVLVSDFVSPESLNKLGKNNAIAHALIQLFDNQMLPYEQNRDTVENQKQEKLTTLKALRNKNELDTGLSQITSKIIDLFSLG